MSRFVRQQLGLFVVRRIPAGEIVVQYFGWYYTVGEYNVPKGRQGYMWAVGGPQGTEKRLLDAYEYGNVSCHGLPVQSYTDIYRLFVFQEAAFVIRLSLVFMCYGSHI
jgi:hypothetical protein